MILSGLFRSAVAAILCICAGITVCGTAVNADVITVNPAAGETIQDAVDIAVTDDEIVLMDGIYVGTGNRNIQIPGEILRLTIRSDSYPDTCIIDAENQAQILSSNGTEMTLSGIRFVQGSSSSGGAVFCNGGSLTISHCEFLDNSAAGTGGAVCLLNTGAGLITNCLFAGNTAGTGAAVYMDFNPVVDIHHSTFHGNTAVGSSAIHSSHGETLNVLYSILWGNNSTEITMEDGELNVAYSDVDQTFPAPNKRLNPLFVPGDYGDYYLADTDAGYPTDSPCVDTFDELPVADYPDMAARTTSPFHSTDTGNLDLGYHYMPDPAFATPTPTLTPTMTPTPTETPVKTPTPTPTPTPAFELDLVLSHTTFTPGSIFSLDVNVANWVERQNPLRLFVVLDIDGEYFMAPGWTEEYQFSYISAPVGRFGVPILSFVWPDVDGEADGLMFHAAMTNTDGTVIVSDPRFPELATASVTFGYQPAAEL